MDIKELLAREVSSFISLDALLNQIAEVAEGSKSEAALLLGRLLYKSNSDAPLWCFFHEVYGKFLI